MSSRRDRGAGLQLDEGARRSPSARLAGDHGGGEHIGMPVQHVLDLDRRDFSPPEMMMSLLRSLS